MGLLAIDKDKIERYVSNLGLKSEHNCLVVYAKMKNGLNAASNLLIRIPSKLSGMFEKPYYFVVTDNKIIIQRTSACKPMVVYKDCVKNFRVETQGDLVTIKFEYYNEEYEFHCYKNNVNSDSSITKLINFMKSQKWCTHTREQH